jgi:hypothetical protein
MLTDTTPRKANRVGFSESDRINAPPAARRTTAGDCKIHEVAMKSKITADVRSACNERLGAAWEFYKVSNGDVHVLAARRRFLPSLERKLVQGT